MTESNASAPDGEPLGYVLGIDLRTARPEAVIAVGAETHPLEVGLVNSPNSPTGATWATEEMVEIAARERGEPPRQVLVCPPPTWTADELDRLDRMLGSSDVVPDHAIVDRPAFGSDGSFDPEATQATPTVGRPLEPAAETPPSAPPPSPTPPPPSPTPTAPSPARPASVPPTYAELTNLPHIDDEPLPDFVRRRQPDRADSDTTESVRSRPEPAAPEGSGPPAADRSAPDRSAPDGPEPPPAQRPPAGSPEVVPAGSSTRLDDVVVGPDRRVAGAFVAGFVIVAVGLAAILLSRGDDDSGAIDAAGTDQTAEVTDQDGTPTDDAQDDESSDDETDDGSEGTPSPPAEGAAAATDCPADQFPDPDVRYRVSDIPERFEAQTLNGRNVPSTSSVGGVDSRVITEFPEFSELDLSRSDCKLNENGRPWWGVTFPAGPDGLAWASTLYIEPIPTEE